jgi:hypothetical protein
MSTQPDDLDPPPADDGADPPNPDPAPADPPEDNGADHPYAPLAIEMGWVPKDKFQGNPEEWKDPETFIRAGRDIQRDTASQLKSVRATLDTLTKTSASLVEQQVNERVAALREKHAEAVEAGDADQALKIAHTIDTTIATATPTNSGPSSEAQAFADRNSSWFQKPGNEYATARAIEICNTLAAQGYKDHGTQLRIAEQRMRRKCRSYSASRRTASRLLASTSPVPAALLHRTGKRASRTCRRKPRTSPATWWSARSSNRRMITCETILRTSQGRHSHERRP